MNAPQQLRDSGHSIWLDSIGTGLITSGELARYIAIDDLVAAAAQAARPNGLMLAASAWVRRLQHHQRGD